MRFQEFKGFMADIIVEELQNSDFEIIKILLTGSLNSGDADAVRAKSDIDLWFTEGQPSEELLGLTALLSPEKWTPSEKDKACPFLEAINDSRKGQSDLSQVLGERVRQAAEILIQAHGSALNENLDSIAAAEEELATELGGVIDEGPAD